MSHTFTIDETEINEYHKKNLPNPLPFTEELSFKNLPGEPVWSSAAKTIGGRSPLFHAVSYAFNQHFPLIITPDSVWLTILNGLVHHIDVDPEEMRKHFVKHDGQLQLTVKVESPPLPNVPGHVWEQGVREFSGQLMEHIGKKANLIVCDFTTTTDTDRLSSQIAMMGAMKHYFKYKMYLACNMGQVTVAGMAQDWTNIHDRVQVLSEFGLQWWTNHLAPVIRELRSTCEGNPDLDLWRRIYLSHRFGSGGQHKVSGWINAFHPYIAGSSEGEMKRNPCLKWTEDSPGVDGDDFPSGLVSAPVLLDDHGKEYDFRFFGGLVGIKLHEDFAVQPVSGWAIQNLGGHHGEM